MTSEWWWLVPSVFLVAALYSSVGHGGASGYLAVLSLLGGALKPEQMATTALTLNVLVAAIGVIAFARAGHFNFSLIWPFAVASVPAAFLGGLTELSIDTYAVLLALSLSIAAARLFISATLSTEEVVGTPSLTVSLGSGGAIGWLSGAVGVGGGIFLSPLLLLKKWATAKQVAAVSAFFILINSIAGLIGRKVGGTVEFGTLWPLLIAAFSGGLVGAQLGALQFSGVILRRVLAVVLLAATVKLIIEAI